MISNLKLKQTLFVVSLFFASAPAFADVSVDVTQLSANMRMLGVILQDVSIMMGLFMFFAGVFRMKRYGEMRTFMSHQMTIAKPMMMLLGGVLLLALPVTIRTAMIAFWNESNPLPYTGDSMDWDAVIVPIILFVRLIGVGSFIRGCVLLSRGGGEQTQPGLYGKALLHIFGGLLCIHVIGTYYLLKNILAMS